MKDKVKPSEADEQLFNETLRRMLKTPPRPKASEVKSVDKPKQDRPAKKS